MKQSDPVEQSVERWLQDDSFVLHCLMPTPQSTTFWKEYVEMHPDEQAAQEEARRIIVSVRFNSVKRLPKETASLWNRIEKEMDRRDYCHTRHRMLLVRYAAACIIAIGIFTAGLLYMFHTPDAGNFTQTADLQTLDLTQREVMLIGKAGRQVQIENNALITYDSVVTVREQGKRKRVLQGVNASDKHTNTLVVPYGRRSSLVLADGSKVWVNAGSILHVPSSFGEKERRIRVEGEIYIEVAKDASRPFYVETSQMTVDVLGTKFNVSAYKDDEVQSVVLAEGKVNIQATEKENCVLSPDQRFQLSTSDRHFSVDEVDATDYIAWKEGILKFRGDTMEEITHRLSRYYNVRISCDPEVAGKCTVGKLLLFDDIKQVMKTFSLLYGISYSIEEGEIRIR